MHVIDCVAHRDPANSSRIPYWSQPDAVEEVGRDLPPLLVRQHRILGMVVKRAMPHRLDRRVVASQDGLLQQPGQPRNRPHTIDDLRLKVVHPTNRCRLPRSDQTLIVMFTVITRPEQVTQHVADVHTARPYTGDHLDARFNNTCNRSAMASRRSTITTPISPEPRSGEPGDACTAWTRADRAANTSR